MAPQSPSFLSRRQGPEAPGRVSVTARQHWRLIGPPGDAGHTAKLVPQVLVVPTEEQPFSSSAPALALCPLPAQPRPHCPEVRQCGRFQIQAPPCSFSVEMKDLLYCPPFTMLTVFWNPKAPHSQLSAIHLCSPYLLPWGVLCQMGGFHLWSPWSLPPRLPICFKRTWGSKHPDSLRMTLTFAFPPASSAPFLSTASLVRKTQGCLSLQK